MFVKMSDGVIYNMDQVAAVQPIGAEQVNFWMAPFKGTPANGPFACTVGRLAAAMADPDVVLADLSGPEDA
jgi:hypothetical protein